MYKLLSGFALLLLACPSSYADASSSSAYLSDIQLLEREFIGCNITYRSLGLSDQYDSCTSQNQQKYKQLIERIKHQYGLTDSLQFKSQQALAVRHHQACLTATQNSPTNQSLNTEIASCNHFYLYSLAAHLLLSQGANANRN